MTLEATLQRLWYERRPWWPLRPSLILLVLLLPLSALFALIVACRRAAFRMGVLTAKRVTRPVIVVGNISVGGTGKTPLVMWLADLLQAQGRRVGIVTRGYGGHATQWPLEVTAAATPAQVGDEPVMMAARTGAIVIAGPDRVAGAMLAISKGADIILSDDGLQHYRLRRDCEIAVVDAQRNLGNGLLLPAGPLREPASRLRRVDLLVRTRRTEGATAPSSAPGEVTATMRLREAVSIAGGGRRALADFRGRPVHALAAIGHPQAFFEALRQLGLQVMAHPLPDHAKLMLSDITFDDDAPVLMTEKDAVKCREFAQARHWSVLMDLDMSERDVAVITVVVERSLQPFRDDQTR